MSRIYLFNFFSTRKSNVEQKGFPVNPELDRELKRQLLQIGSQTINFCILELTIVFAGVLASVNIKPKNPLGNHVTKGYIFFCVLSIFISLLFSAYLLVITNLKRPLPQSNGWKTPLGIPVAFAMLSFCLGSLLLCLSLLNILLNL